MVQTMIDTLHFANKLKAAGVSQEHAEIQAETLAEVLVESHKQLATKTYVSAAIDKLRSELIKWFIVISLSIAFSQTALIFSMLKSMH